MAQDSPAALRVLFVEDSADDVELIRRELSRHGFQISDRITETREDFAAAIREGTWDVVLSDHSMEGFSSTEALNLLRDFGSDIPFIIVSGTIGEDSAVDAMRSGAQDYVLKHNLRRLGPAVERELREAANRRLQRSTQAALQASEQRLRHAQRMEAVGRLAGGIAHDFNNLLTVILGFSEFLIEQLPPGEPAYRDASEIRMAAQRATRLTRQLLAFSRQQVLERRVIDLVETVSELQPMVARLIGEDVQFTFTHAPPPQLVLIDPGQFEQIVMNLVINARDAMPSGGRLTVNLDRARVDAAQAADLEIPDGEYVVLTVADTGNGIEPAIVDHIFEPFFTTKDPGRGTGLGLSTVFGIVHQCGGAIAVSSIVNAGTTFRLYLPLSTAKMADAAVTAAPVAASLRSSTILLAEDEQGVRSFLEMALSRAGHRVIATSSGSSAVDAGLKSREPIDLLIADVVMPGMAGPEVADRLRQKHPGMRALFLSGYATHAALPDRVTTDPGAFLQKPFTVESLLSKVRERLART
ncbi:MAG TPA: response regulator [Vicinamibacterales bacterium]|nr:response regulator [Vicinamibacterales bacterium]